MAEVSPIDQAKKLISTHAGDQLPAFEDLVPGDQHKVAQHILKTTAGIQASEYSSPSDIQKAISHAVANPKTLGAQEDRAGAKLY